MVYGLNFGPPNATVAVDGAVPDAFMVLSYLVASLGFSV